MAARLDVLSPLSRVLAQLSVLLPVLDDDKHYWIGDAEVDKLLQRGGEWLAAHPHKDIIARRYLKHQESYGSLPPLPCNSSHHSTESRSWRCHDPQ